MGGRKGILVDGGFTYVKKNQISSETMTRDYFKRLIRGNFLGTCKSRSAKTGKYDSRINVKPNL